MAYSTGIILILTQLLISFLSHSFVFGQGHGDRPILLFLLLEGIAFVAYFLAVEWVRKLSGDKNYLGWIFFVAILSRVLLFPSALIQETDPYRYVWDGQTILAGENPYRLAPSEAIHPSTGEFVHQKINHPTVKTIYPPLAQALFALSQWMSPWQLTGWKILMFAAEIGILLLLMAILGAVGLRKEWILLYAWCPLVLKEFSNSLHLDVFAVLLLTAMIYFLVKHRIQWAYVTLALATLTKFFPILLLPLLLVWKKTLRGLALFAAVIFLFYLPFLSAGGSLFEGLGLFASRWQVNEGLFGLIRSRIVCAFLVLIVIALFTRWLGWRSDLKDFGQASLAVCASVFFLAPAANPWYFTWIFPFLFFLPLRSLVIFSGLVFLYYLDFYFSYRGAPGLFLWVRIVEYGLFYALLGYELWQMRKQFPSFFPPRTSEALLPVR